MNESQLEIIADKIVRLGLTTPALFFLELNKPVSSILHTTTLMFQPIATPLFGAERVATLEQLLADRNNIEKLMQRIEARAADKGAN